jgi:hypothetical protein
MSKAVVALTLAAALAASAASAAPRPLTPQDYIDIHQLNGRYALATDTGDGPGRAATFTPDGSFRGFGNNGPYEPIASLAARTSRNGNTGGRHFMANEVITATEEGADMTSYALILQPQNREKQPVVGIACFYTDKLVRTPQGWRFKTRAVWCDSDPASPFKAKPPAAQ